MKSGAIFAANWKMNKTLAEVKTYVDTLKSLVPAPKDFEVILAAQATHLPELQKVTQGSAFEVSAQNCGFEASGAFTGEISPATLKELGVPWVILGHSERRHVFGESVEMVGKRLKGALSQGLKVIFCVGETLEQRKSGKTFEVIAAQLPKEEGAGMVLAYEPIWAIGTGETATPAQAQEVHAFIRRSWKGAILYGGSVNAKNSGLLLKEKDIGGLLVGGASLDPNSFADLIKVGLGLPA